MIIFVIHKNLIIFSKTKMGNIKNTTSDMHIQFSGCIVNTKVIISAILIFIVEFLVMGFIYIQYLNNLLFYLSPYLPLIVQIFILGILITITSLAFKNIYSKDNITIDSNENSIIITINNKLFSEIQFNDINSFMLKTKNDVFDLITIELLNRKRIKINLGKVFTGIKDSDFSNKMSQLSALMEKKLKAKKRDVNGLLVINRKNENNSHLSKFLKIIFIAFVSIIFCIASVYILTVYVFGDDDPDGKVARYGEDFGNSNYKVYDNQIYFLDVGNGYFKVKGADYKSFKPLTKKGQYSTNMGIDDFHVFYDNKQVPNINRKQVRYVGAYYTADDKNVYYKDKIVTGANSATFQLAEKENSNSMKFPYGIDKDHVYYESYLLEKLNPEKIRFFNAIYSFVTDDQYVYYKNQILPNADGNTLEVENVDYKLTFAKDNSHFWINAIEFPDKVQNRLLGTTDVDKLSLKLLAKKGIGTAHMIFYDNKHLFCFDEYEQEFYLLKDMDNISDIKRIANNVYSLDNEIYFFIRRSIFSRSRGSTKKNEGIETKFVRLKDVKTSDFKVFKETSGGTIYTNGSQYFYNIVNDTYSKSSIYILDEKQVNNDASRYISDDFLTAAPYDKTLFTIRSRPER